MLKHPSSDIDVALQTYPLARAPRTLAPAVMARIRALSPARPRFQLEWMDFALSLFAATMLGLGYGLWRAISPQAATQASAQFHFQVALLQQQLSLLPFPPANLWLAAFSVVAVVGVTLLTTGLLLAPRWRA